MIAVPNSRSFIEVWQTSRADIIMYLSTLPIFPFLSALSGFVWCLTSLPACEHVLLCVCVFLAIYQYKRNNRLFYLFFTAFLHISKESINVFNLLILWPFFLHLYGRSCSRVILIHVDRCFPFSGEDTLYPNQHSLFYFRFARLVCHTSMNE